MSLGSDGLAAVSRIGTRKYYFAGKKTVSITSSALASNPIPSINNIDVFEGEVEVQLHATAACYVYLGTNTNASSTNGMPLIKNEKIHVRVNAGDVVSVIRDFEDGVLHILPVDDR